LLQNYDKYVKATKHIHYACLRRYDYRRFSGDESFLKDPNAYNDAKNTAALQVVDEPVSEVTDKAEDKSRL
jgi:hypothetical protein